MSPFELCSCCSCHVFRLFRPVLRLRANGCNNSQHCCADNVGSCCVRVGSGVQTDATTPKNVGRAVQTIQHCCATLRRSRNKRNVGSCWLKSLTSFKLCATTSNRMQQGVQTDATCNIQQCWELLANNVPSVCSGLYSWNE